MPLGQSPGRSVGSVALPGGLLQWHWAGRCSEATIATADEQLQKREELVNRFLRRQEDLISLFLEGLVHGQVAAADGGLAVLPQGLPLSEQNLAESGRDLLQRSMAKEGTSLFPLSEADPDKEAEEKAEHKAYILPFDGIMREASRKGMMASHSSAKTVQTTGSSLTHPSCRTINDGALSPLPSHKTTRRSQFDDLQIVQTPTSVRDMSLKTDLPRQDMNMRKGATLYMVVQPAIGFHKWLIKWVHWWATLEEPRRRGCLADFVNCSFFKAMCFLVIALNTVVMIRSTNMMMKFQSEDEPLFDIITEAIFLVCYSVELALKIAVHRVYFFCNDEMFWNMFDVFIVGLSIISAYEMAGSKNTYENVSFLRTFRILKLSKIFRIFRVIVFLRDLRIMLTCVVNSFMSLIWCFALLALIMVIFSIFFVQSLTRYLVENGEGAPQDVSDMIISGFPSVEGGMITLFMLAFGGMEWSDTYRLLEHTGVMNCTVLLFFIGLYQVSIFNIATGLFVEKALKYGRPDLEMEILEQRREAMGKVHVLKQLCQELDLDKSGDISREEFMDRIREPNVRFAFSLEGLDIRDAEAFFDILTTVRQGGDRIDTDTFVAGCLRMRGLATSIDLQTLGFDLKMHIMATELLNDDIRRHLVYVENELGKVQSQLRAQDEDQQEERAAACKVSDIHMTMLNDGSSRFGEAAANVRSSLRNQMTASSTSLHSESTCDYEL